MASVIARAARWASSAARLALLMLLIAGGGEPDGTSAPPIGEPTAPVEQTPTATPRATPTATPTAMSTHEEQDGEPEDCSAAGLDAEVSPQELPEAVADTRADIAEAAAACDYDRLDELAGEDLECSFGDDDDAIGHWRRGEEAGDEPLRHLVELLDRPHATIESSEGTQYVWPSAFAYDSWDQVPEEERNALRPLYDEEDFAFFTEFGGYIGYRVGIDGDGEWQFFIAGD